MNLKHYLPQDHNEFLVFMACALLFGLLVFGGFLHAVQDREELHQSEVPGEVQLRGTRSKAVDDVHGVLGEDVRGVREGTQLLSDGSEGPERSPGSSSEVRREDAARRAEPETRISAHPEAGSEVERERK